MRLLVTGGAGMLGQAVTDAAGRLGHEVIALSHAQLDITDAAHVARVVPAADPAAIVNCAAWTDVDGAEANEARALAVNGEGAGNVARAAAAIGARLVHVSTDYVFDGERAHAAGGAGEPWLESDRVAPLQAYGRTKLAGERAVAEAGGEHAIVRTAWLFGAGGPNFVGTMLRLGRELHEVVVVRDQVGCPTYTGHLADALLRLVEDDDFGLHHIAGGGECSWFEFGVEIFKQAGVECRTLSCTTADFPRPARRPAHSVLGTEREYALYLPDWQQGLRGYLGERAVAR
jgi:dTDP-4-dehydrorhamnose reductase